MATIATIATMAAVLATAALTGCNGDDGGNAGVVGGDAVVVSTEPWEEQALAVSTVAAGFAGSGNDTGSGNGSSTGGTTRAADPAELSAFALYAVATGDGDVAWPVTLPMTLTWNDGSRQWSNDGLLFWPKGVSRGDFFAYAPYVDPQHPNDITPAWNPGSGTGTGSGTGPLTVTYAAGPAGSDLLYASHEGVRHTEAVQLHFRHALAKLSWGTVTDRSGTAFTVTKVRVGATLYSKRTFDVATATWTDSDAETTVISDYDIYTNDGGAETRVSPLFIPRKAVALTLTISYTATNVTGTQTVSVTHTTDLEQGRHYTLNLTVGRNHEVTWE